ncbi:MAG TPA: hypothetical protein VJ546_03675 [Bacillales bacterium]|nr:hypothetical protein [Bacillales bacterium]
MSILKEQLATVYTSFGTITTGAFGVSSLIMGLLSDYFGVQIVFVLSGVLLAIVCVVAYKNKRLFAKNEMNQTSGFQGKDT